MSIARPLDGIRVIEVGQLLAGPFAGTMLAYFGAEVIKVEPPGNGDPIRNWRLLDETGTGYWWRSLGRNKKSVTVNLRSDEGRQILKQLIDRADVLIENFKPGTMEKWGLGPEDIKAANPDLIYARISGYGQTGPYSRKPGYASVTEAFSGFRYINGFPGEVPIRPNLSLGDSVAGIHAALGILLALLAKNNAPPREASGQVVDVALYESMFNLMEGVLPEYDGGRAVREPAGSTLTGIVPTNTYLCADGKHVVIGGNGDSIYVRLMTAIGRGDLAKDPSLEKNPGRVIHQQKIDDAIAAWTSVNTSATVITCLEQVEVPVGPIFSIADASKDPHYIARKMFEEVVIKGKSESEDRRLKIPAILPKLSRTPGKTTWPGGEVGSHTEIILAEIGYDKDRQADLKNAGHI
jgi:crotonobetainyl-CoA:carnitine CoA-transferase CaiB-like acyl-CoA transferase